MTFLGVLVLCALCWLIGFALRGLLASPGEIRPYRCLLQLLAGWVVLYLGQWLLHFARLPWSAATLVGWLLLAASCTWALGRRHAMPSTVPTRLSWGDAVALLALGSFAFCALKLWILNPDFIYHWGIKGEKFHLAGGIDGSFLSARWNRPRHPNYPLLYPGQLAAAALVAGKFAEPAQMLWTVLPFAGLLAAARQVLVRLEVATFARQATMALLGLVLATFGIGYLMAGSPDWLLALALLAAWPLLLRPEPEASSALALGTLAAIAAGAKMEGLPLAALLLLAFTATRASSRPRAFALASIPLLCVVLPWVIFNHQQGLTQLAARGDLEPSNLWVVLGSMARAVAVPEWWGFAWLLLALPWLLRLRSTRVVAAIGLAQLSFYLVVYLTFPYSEPDQVTLFVLSNFARLAFHLMPTVIVACGVAIDYGLKAEVSPLPQISPGGLS